MKKVQCRNLVVCLSPFLILSLFLLFFFGPFSDHRAKANSSDYSLFVWQTINSGGNSYMSSNDTIISTVGQICTGVMEGGGYKMGIGYICEGSPTKVEEQEDENTPYSFSLSQNYPNPFNPTTNIEFELPRPSLVRIEIFNILGQKVRILVDDHMKAGHKLVDWDGKDKNGNDVSSGIYFCRLQAGEFAQTKKMVLLR